MHLLLTKCPLPESAAGLTHSTPSSATEAMMFPALVSVHDVMPTTLDNVAHLIRLCKRHGVDNITLLVVPGLDWQPAEKKQLQQWQGQGCVLAAHGWQHHCQRVRTWQHRLHSCLLSRNVAEHLSLESDDVVRLMLRSERWFHQQTFAVPELYVPPAWALGKISSQQLRQLPFRMIETLTSVLLPRENRRLRLPLVGFEADTLTRQVTLSFWNRIARAYAFYKRIPLRVAIHPLDHRLRLQHDLVRTLALPLQAMAYPSLSTKASAEPLLGA